MNGFLLAESRRAIVTPLDRPAVVTALRELAPKTHNVRIFRSTFEGDIWPDRISIGYRCGWFVPPIRLVTFSGVLRQTDGGTTIDGPIRAAWVFYVLGVWLATAFPFAIYHYVTSGDAGGAISSLVAVVLLFFLGRAFLRSTQDYVVREIARAVRGRIESRK